MSPMVEYALDYARRGWPVFPCNPSPCPGFGKKPLVRRDRDASGQPIRNTGGLAKATTDADQIRAWWSRWPDALIGARMGAGAGVFAIDPDAPSEPGEPDGLTAWRALLEKHGGIPHTHTHQTPGGGLHVLFRWRPERPVTNSEGSLPPGINVRGEGGYVIAPPSRLCDGRAYGVVEPVDFFCFADAPEWLLDLIAPVPREAEPARPRDAAPSRSHDTRARRNAYVAAALERECEAVSIAPRGTRNTRLNQAAFSLGTLATPGALEPDHIAQRLLAAAQVCGLHEDGPGGSVQATIDSGLRAGLAKPRQALPPRRSQSERSAAQGYRDGTSSPVTQDDIARRFAERFAGRLRYCHHTGAWFAWTGEHWQRDETSLAFQFARELGREVSEGRDPKEMKEARKVSFAAGVERFAQGDRAFAVTSTAWDADPFLLGTPGGTVDLRTGDLRPANPSDGITRLTAVTPVETPGCPLWLRYLDEASGGDGGLVRFMQQWCGYSLTGDVREHALVFVYGSGGNGKSVFLNTVSRVVGEYAVTAPMDTFTASKSDRHPTDLAMLRGARLVTASETEEGRAWAESRIKQMTGGDPVSARFMRQDFFTYMPQFKLTIVGNHKPILRNVDEAARRRFNLVPFTRKPVAPDRELEAKLEAEWPAILRWMIEGCLDWKRNGLIRPPAVRAATDAYFEDQDLFAQWLDEECDTDPGNDHKWETVATLFASWREFAERAGETAGSTKAFSERMQRAGFEPHRRNKARTLRGVRLRPRSVTGDGW